jgi:hypothetical protein
MWSLKDMMIGGTSLDIHDSTLILLLETHAAALWQWTKPEGRPQVPQESVSGAL